MILTLALSGCSKPATETGSEGGGEEEATAADEIIKVLLDGFTDGDQAVWGQCELNTVKML